MAHDDDLDRRVAEMTARFGDAPIPRPPNWSGFRVIPERIEFWKNMPSRLHVRHVFSREGTEWAVSRLYP
jgi:pyridoxamine 5'-phosphate oxidase